jgi:hypothetical protein
MPGEGKIGLSLERRTVEELRKGKGSETWDVYLLRLIRRTNRTRIECIVCGKRLETEDIHVSPSVLAEMHDWGEVSAKDKDTGEKGRVLGFACTECLMGID